MPKKSREKNKLSPKERRDLEVEIGFLSGLIRRDPEYVAALQILGDDLTRVGRLEEGLRVDQQLACLRPQDPVVFYNLACSLSLTSQFDGATAALEQALDLGYSDFKWLDKDPDLASLRQQPHFDRIRARVKKQKS